MDMCWSLEQQTILIQEIIEWIEKIKVIGSNLVQRFDLNWVDDYNHIDFSTFAERISSCISSVWDSIHWGQFSSHSFFPLGSKRDLSATEIRKRRFHLLFVFSYGSDSNLHRNSIHFDGIYNLKSNDRLTHMYPFKKRKEKRRERENIDIDRNSSCH